MQCLDGSSEESNRCYAYVATRFRRAGAVGYVPDTCQGHARAHAQANAVVIFFPMGSLKGLLSHRSDHAPRLLDKE